MILSKNVLVSTAMKNLIQAVYSGKNKKKRHTCNFLHLSSYKDSLKLIILYMKLRYIHYKALRTPLV